jgi:hypothetical protein
MLSLSGSSVIDNLRSVQAHERSQEWVWARLSKPDASRLLAIQRDRKSRDESMIEHYKNLFQRRRRNIGPLDGAARGNANPACRCCQQDILLHCWCWLTGHVRRTEYAQFTSCIVVICMG